MDQMSIALCRQGFENELASELSANANRLGIAAYCKTEVNQAYVQLIHQGNLDLQLDSLIFARQLLSQAREVGPLPETDRATPLAEAVCEFIAERPCSAIVLESPDSEGKGDLQRFLRKFRQPLMKKLQQLGLALSSEGELLHICFLNYRKAIISLNNTKTSSPLPGGIKRLKKSSLAPSRSALKLEEALVTMVSDQAKNEIFRKGSAGVDLGAAPGGWTSQLIARGMYTFAVDNGPLAPAIAESPLVEWCREDGFKFYPRQPVELLVCDMVEKPSLISQLIIRWFDRQWCSAALFNLKLPMKKRYQAVRECLDLISKETSYCVYAKQLYHDREEITVYLNSRLQ